MSEFDMVENAQKERDKGVRYSVVKDQNGYPFVENSRGSIDFGTISNLVGMENAPIRLSSGFDSIDKNGKHHGYGFRHMSTDERTREIKDAGYKSVVAFVEDVASNYTTVRKGSVRGGNQTYLLEVVDDHNNTLFIELSRDGSYWNVNSGGVFRSRYSKNKEVIPSSLAVGGNIVGSSAEVQGDNSNNLMSENSSGMTSSRVKDTSTSENSNKEPMKLSLATPKQDQKFRKAYESVDAA